MSGMAPGVPYPPEDWVALDFETYSDVNLAKQGLDNYVNSVYFQPLIAVITYLDENGDMESMYFDFINGEDTVNRLRASLGSVYIVAHNASFEQSVLRRIGIDIPSSRFIDTAVLTRASGYGGSLEASAAQVLLEDKLESGRDLIQLFCIPPKDGTSLWFDKSLVDTHAVEWQEFYEYCLLDTQLSFRLAEELLTDGMIDEIRFSHLTMDMNQRGWFVDMPLVQQMSERYEANTHQALVEFKDRVPSAKDLNLNSSTQLIAWCKARGVNSKSFDEKNVARLLRRLKKKIAAGPLPPQQLAEYNEVVLMLETKQLVSGAALRKLDTIKRMVNENDCRLRNSYLHVGAAATFRTSGRGVQMQNLKRLHGGGDDVTALHDPMVWWPNDKMADNLRQLFRAQDSQGQLIVGDFSSVESRALAWQAGERWKTDAYFEGKDLYKVQAAKMFGIAYDYVDKSQRQVGKVGELACGYGAGPGAVREFASKMGVDLTEDDAVNLVKDWRDANDRIVRYWRALDDGLRRVLEFNTVENIISGHGVIKLSSHPAPMSLRQQVGNLDLRSIKFEYIPDNMNYSLFERFIHGAHLEGKQIHYWKPSERKTGPLWSEKYTDPKTKKVRYYSIYGGKMAGLITQSLCREMFFHSLSSLDLATRVHENLKIIGQFHDEIVLEWSPISSNNYITLKDSIKLVEIHMSSTHLRGFPLAAEVNSAHRYIK